MLDWRWLRRAARATPPCYNTPMPSEQDKASGFQFNLQALCGVILVISVLRTLWRLGTGRFVLLPIQTAILLAVLGRLKTASGMLLILLTIGFGLIVTVAL